MISWVIEVLAAYIVWCHRLSVRGPVWEHDISVQSWGGTIQHSFIFICRSQHFPYRRLLELNPNTRPPHMTCTKGSKTFSKDSFPKRAWDQNARQARVYTDMSNGSSKSRSWHKHSRCCIIMGSCSLWDVCVARRAAALTACFRVEWPCYGVLFILCHSSRPRIQWCRAKDAMEAVPWQVMNMVRRASDVGMRNNSGIL